MTEIDMPLMPSVSVIMTVHNGERYLEAALRSIFDQNYPVIEVVVTDDGSSDGTAGVIARFEEKVVYRHQKKSGIAAGWNNSLAHSTGDYLCFLDADDLWSSDKLRIQLPLLLDDEATDATFGHVKEFYSQDMRGDDRSRFRIQPTPSAGWHAGTMLIRRQRFFDVGLFDTRWKKGIFNDWFLRASEKSLATRMCPETLLYRRIHGANHGVLNKSAYIDYVRILKASIDRRKGKAARADQQHVEE